MKELVKIKGPRDCNLIEIEMHISNLQFHYQSNRKTFEDNRLSFEARQGAYVQICRTIELLKNWREVRADILKKGGVPRGEIRVS